MMTSMGPLNEKTSARDYPGPVVMSLVPQRDRSALG